LVFESIIMYGKIKLDSKECVAKKRLICERKLSKKFA
jgi:hypothetical protein